MKCPIKGCSEDCKECDGNSTTWKDDDGELKECVFVIVWKARQKPQSSSVYEPLCEGKGLK